MSIATGRTFAGAAAGLFMAVALALPLHAQGAREDAPPEEPVTVDPERVFLDTRVADVAVDEMMTVVTLAQSPRSPCPSPFYVYERDRPKWLYQTGRFLQAMREDAEIRISFTCRDGVQVINAMMFMSPPPAMVATGMPTRRQTVEAQTSTIRPAGGDRLVDPPLPVPASATAGDPVRSIPLP